MPLVLGGVQQLLPDITPHWCMDNLPATSLESCDHLHIALAGALDSSEAELHLQVKSLLLNIDVDTAYTVDNCLQQKGLTLKQYIAKASNMGTSIDGLFI